MTARIHKNSPFLDRENLLQIGSVEWLVRPIESNIAETEMHKRVKPSGPLQSRSQLLLMRSTGLLHDASY